MSLEYQNARAQTAVPALPVQANVRAITGRSVLLGLVGITLICGLTPYNDWVAGNTFLIGNFFPLGVVLFLMLFLVLINAPLSRWWPNRAVKAPELAVALGMMLVACTIPGSGLMKWLPAGLIGTQQHAAANPDYQQTLRDLDLPDWVFPTFATPLDHQRGNDPVVQNFVHRTPRDGDTLAHRVMAVPWRAWVPPAIGWGVLLAGLYTAVLCLVVIVRRQWVENERLPFPLASVWISLIQTPESGRAFNSLFQSRGFWIAASIVFAIHLLNGLATYSPGVPQIPVGFNFAGVFSEGPLRHTDWLFKISRIYFAMVGITYFLRTNVIFSLWFFYLINQSLNVGYGVLGAERSPGAMYDQGFGSLVVFGGMILWVGRHQWSMVLRHMFRARSADEPDDSYLSYRIAGWGFVAGNVVMMGWLMWIGASFGGAMLITMLFMLMMLVMARVVAETGLMFVSLGVYVPRPFIMGLSLPLVPVEVSQKTFFAGGLLNQSLAATLRESLSPFAIHALRVKDGVADEQTNGRTRLFVPLLGMSLLLAYLISGASSLYVQYNHGSTLSSPPASPINAQALDLPVPLLSQTSSFTPPYAPFQERHHAWGHFTLGAGITALLSYLRLRFVGWPLHPVGYLLMNSYPLSAVWFSLFVGWLVKVPLLRYGGAELFRNARGFFIGLIVGEVAAAALWLGVNLLLSTTDITYHPINLLPG